MLLESIQDIVLVLSICTIAVTLPGIQGGYGYSAPFRSLVLEIPIALYVLYILKYQWASQVEGYVNYASHHTGNI